VTQIDLVPYQELLSIPTRENYQQLLELLMEEIFAERGCIWLERENVFLYNGDEDLRKRFPFSRQAVDSVLDHGRSFISFDATSDDRLRPSGSIAMNNVRSCLCAACQDQSGAVLVLAYFDNSMSSGQFSEEDLQLLKDVLSLVPGAVPVRA
jgi:GAF domain-containing protein